MNQGWVYQERVKQSAAGKTVLDYYSQTYRHSSLTQWQARIKTGQIRLNGQLTSSQTILKSGDKLAYHRPPWQEPKAPLNFSIIYQDQDILAIAKPAGLPVLPGGGFLENTVLFQLKKLYPESTPVPIHRLGRGTSGLLLLARSQLAKSHLSEQMRGNYGQKNQKTLIQKIYRALIPGNSIPNNLTIDLPIGKIPHPTLGYIYASTPQGKFAYSQVKVIQRTPENTIVEVNILTGRPHQIRIHLAAVGYPLVGDNLYTRGGKVQIFSHSSQDNPVPGDCGYLLHAYRLSFLHPRTEKLIQLVAPAPAQLI